MDDAAFTEIIYIVYAYNAEYGEEETVSCHKTREKAQAKVESWIEDAKKLKELQDDLSRQSPGIETVKNKDIDPRAAEEWAKWIHIIETHPIREFEKELEKKYPGCSLACNPECGMYTMVLED